MTQNESTTPTAAIPAPARTMLTGMSQRICHRSPSAPKAGWTTEDTSENASTMPAAAA
jgi:hypothetical protein